MGLGLHGYEDWKIVSPRRTMVNMAKIKYIQLSVLKGGLGNYPGRDDARLL